VVELARKISRPYLFPLLRNPYRQTDRQTHCKQSIPIWCDKRTKARFDRLVRLPAWKRSRRYSPQLPGPTRGCVWAANRITSLRDNSFAETHITTTQTASNVQGHGSCGPDGTDAPWAVETSGVSSKASHEGLSSALSLTRIEHAPEFRFAHMSPSSRLRFYVPAQHTSGYFGDALPGQSLRRN